jgi:transmembrane sensor
MKLDQYEKLAAWLAGEPGAAAPAEADSVEGKEARETWKLSGRYRYAGNSGEDWANFMRDQLHQMPAAEKAAGPRISYWLLGAAMAASIAAIWFTFFYKPQPPVQRGMETAVYYNSALGEQKHLSLPDASRVQLNAGSAFWILPGYGSQERAVELKGEAFFEVVPDGKVFMVKTGKAAIKVTGTAFNVRNYQDDVMVHVKEGRVIVSEGKQQLEIKAGEGAVFYASKGTLEPVQGDSMAWAWTRGKLVFKDATLGEVAAELGRTCNVQLVVPAGMAGRRYTGSFENMELETVLAIIEKAMGVRLEIAAEQ